MNKGLHIPVMLDEVLAHLQPIEGGRFADLTFGEGGHSEALLRAGAEKVVAFDRDPEALALYREHGEFRDDPRLELHNSVFSEIPEIVGKSAFDGILADLGVSTRQLLVGERGFSFSQPGPVDMRMNQADGIPLARLLDKMSLDNLIDELRKNADLKSAHAVARRILDAHRAGKLSDTRALADLAGAPRPHKSHPATPMFLALRMMVNEELSEIENGLPKALGCLKPGGKLVVITFHSTEDRAVKRLFRRLSGGCGCDGTPCRCPRIELAHLVTRKPIEPGPEELSRNPRARSAKLRCVEFVGAPS